MNVQIRRPALDLHIPIPDFFKDVVGQMFKRGKRPDHSNFAAELIESTMLHAAQPGAAAEINNASSVASVVEPVCANIDHLRKVSELNLALVVLEFAGRDASCRHDLHHVASFVDCLG